MKLVFPTNKKDGINDQIAEHFGRCFTYTFVNENGELEKIINNTSEHMGGVGLPPELMKKAGADILICKDLGPKALILCKQLGIDVYVCEAKMVKEAFKMWANREIKKADMTNVCDEHKE